MPTAGPAIHATIHFVPPERVRMEPDELLTACGAWSEGNDWSTNPRVVSCAKCLVACARRDPVRVEQPPARAFG